MNSTNHNAIVPMMTDLDAAQALLDLQFAFTENKETFDVEIVEKPPIARIFGTFISSPVTELPTNTSTPKKSFLNKWNNSKETKIEGDFKNLKVHDAETQTDSIPVLLIKKDEIIKELSDENVSLKQELQKYKDKDRCSATDSFSERYSESSKEDTSECLRKSNRRPKPTFNKTQSSSHEDTTILNEKQYKNYQKEAPNKNKRIQNSNSDVVPIGDGNAIVPVRLLKYIDWSCHSNATRKLLTAVFSRQVLATHSLTGKPSPAFPNKPAKKKLDAALVNDIVQTVVERCGVPENIVRTNITTKCADESKMLRTRQHKKKSNKKIKKENLPPSDDSDISEELYLST